MSYQNKLLSRLSADDRDRLAPLMQKIELEEKQILLEPRQVIDYVYFPETSICSMLAATEKKPAIEVGMFGYEGMSNFVTRPGDRSYLRTTVLLPGEAWRISAAPFAEALSVLPTLNESVLRFKDALAVQFAYTSFANGSFSIEQRLARWLLMMQDRARRDVFTLVHDTMAGLLAVRRSGITNATHVLEGEGAIRTTRGSITIRDRDRLIALAGESYGSAEYAYSMLFPTDQRATGK
ncbi:MAG: Crp/Fnr family transcriptional regulator [Beijerinckiaceae bacterium]|nr:Crp/Fnr family transcriptional regulator [Beijerinckiaceae bacterium]